MRLQDSLTTQKWDFAPLDGEVKMYVCGVTPYAPCHMGHALSYIYFDVLRRYLEFSGHIVRHVQNFTDIDDKIIQRARDENISTSELAERYISGYFQDMGELNIQPAHVYPRATEEVPGILDMIQGLIDKGYAYPSSEGDVYYRVKHFRGYGKLSHRDLEGMVIGARVEAGLNKEHAMDFTLWKASKPGEPSWESPWGEGRPGWHIECSAMSLRYLGSHLDIHGGGQDLIFPHHENEIAQTEAFTGVEPFVRFWIHNGLMQLGEDKMSKSLGNLVTVREALSRFSPDALRLFVLTSHYRSPQVYSDELLISQERAVERLRGATARVNGDDGVGEPIDAELTRRRFILAMDDDLNTPQALASLFDLARDINRGREAGRPVASACAVLGELAGVLGLTLVDPADSVQPAEAPLIELLVKLREELRAAQQYALADRIRDELEKVGVTLEDTSHGTLRRRKIS